MTVQFERVDTPAGQFKTLGDLQQGQYGVLGDSFNDASPVFMVSRNGETGDMFMSGLDGSDIAITPENSPQPVVQVNITNIAVGTTTLADVQVGECAVLGNSLVNSTGAAKSHLMVVGNGTDNVAVFSNGARSAITAETGAQQCIRVDVSVSGE